MSPAVRVRGRAWARGLIVSAWALGACSPAAPTGAADPSHPGAKAAAQAGGVAAAAFPAGTVLTLNGAPIRADEVDAIGSIVARVEVQHTLPNLRRIALTNVILPRVAARQLVGEEKYAAARALADSWHATLARGETQPAPMAGPPEEVLEGGLLQIGLEVWNWAIDAPLETWSEPIETVGAWRLARVLERSAGMRPADVKLKVEVRTFVWDAAASFRKDVEDQLDRSKLEFVDETWRDVVPTLWQRRLRGSP